jgi:hypothetical protein
MVSVRGGIDRALLEFCYLPDTRLSLLYLIKDIDALAHNFYLSTIFLPFQVHNVLLYVVLQPDRVAFTRVGSSCEGSRQKFGWRILRWL